MEVDSTTPAQDAEEATAMEAEGPAVAEVELEPETEAEPEPELVVERVEVEAKPGPVPVEEKVELASPKVVSEPPPSSIPKSESRSGRKRPHPDD